MQQLKYLINHTNVPTNPKNNTNSADDFIHIITVGNVIALAMTHFSMKSIDDVPVHKDIDTLQALDSVDLKRNQFHQGLQNMLQNNITLFTIDCLGKAETASDGVTMYAKELLSLGLLYSEFRDAIQERDEDRLLSCWKFFLPIFRADRNSRILHKPKFCYHSV